MFKNLAKELREFILRGNVLDMAVGIIIGASFKSIVDSMVNDIIMPVISLFTGKLDFANWFVALDGNTYKTLAEAQEAGAATLNYGNFISGIINFVIMAFVVFMLVKSINNMKKEEAPAPAAPTAKKCPFCKTEIPLDATRCPHCTSALEQE